MNEYTTGVITGVIISAVATLALAPVTGHIHASVAESRMEAAMEEWLGDMPNFEELMGDLPTYEELMGDMPTPQELMNQLHTPTQPRQQPRRR